MTLKNSLSKCSSCFISQWMKGSKHGLFVFKPKKTLIWRRHSLIGQSCCSMTSKRSIGWFLGSSRARMKFFHPNVRLTNTCSHCTKVWHGTYSRSVKSSFAPLQNSGRNRRSYVSSSGGSRPSDNGGGDPDPEIRGGRWAVSINNFFGPSGLSLV